MKLDDRAAALIALVEADRATRTAAVLDPAASDAREVLRHARKAARRRVATAIAEERAAFAARVGAAEARVATARRMADQRRFKALVAEGWAALTPALLARWRDATQRREWIQAALEQGMAILPRGPWRVDVPADWSEPDRTQVGIESSFATDPAIAAGLRITSGKVELDATLAGLLADRLLVEGRLLHWHQP